MDTEIYSSDPHWAKPTFHLFDIRKSPGPDRYIFSISATDEIKRARIYSTDGMGMCIVYHSIHTW